MTKTIFRLIASATMAVLTALLLLAANTVPTMFFSVYSDFSRWILGIIAEVTTVVPFAVWELLLVGLVIWFIVSLIQAIAKLHILRWASGLLLTVCVLVFLFVGIWGLNYYAPSMQTYLGLPEKQYTATELKEAASYYLQCANELAPQVERDENGIMVEYDFFALAEQAGEGYEALAERYTCFGGSTARVKTLLSSSLLGAGGTTGIFVCLTGESCVCSTTFSASVPFTMAHELGHRMAFAREDEANFAGFLACTTNERAEFRYSGYLHAFIYCYNALGRVDADGQREVAAQCASFVVSDIRAMREHYNAVENEKVTEVSSTVYDNYLQAFSVESGVQSYGEVTDLLLTWYFERIK